jgi:glycosyltransferase involved in cell wall biosynthesis
MSDSDSERRMGETQTADCPKTVWILNHYATEPDGSGGTRHFNLARYAAEHGIRVILIAASVEHLSGRQRLAAGERSRVEELDGVTFLWLRTPTYRGNGPARIRNILSYTWQSLRAVNTASLPVPDLIVGSSVHPLAAWAAAKLARRHRVPFVFEIRDLWPETLIQMGRVHRYGPVAICLRTLERRLCQQASRVIVLLPKAHLYLEKIGVTRDKVIWIPNGVDLSRFPCRPLEDRTPLTVMYFGAHGQANGLESLLEAIARLQSHPSGGKLRFRFIGDGPMKPLLEAEAQRCGLLSQVSFEPPVSKREIPKLAAAADAFMINVRSLSLYRYGFSFNKLFDYLAAGRPVLFAGPDENPIAEAKAGLVLAPDDVDAIASAMVELANMSFADRREMGLRGRRYAEENCDSRVLAARLIEVLQPLLANADEQHNRVVS